MKQRAKSKAKKAPAVVEEPALDDTAAAGAPAKDTTVDDAQAALRELESQLSELEALSRNTVARTEGMGKEYHEAVRELEAGVQGGGTVFRDQRAEDGAKPDRSKVLLWSVAAMAALALVAGAAMVLPRLGSGSNPDPGPVPPVALADPPADQQPELGGVNVSCKQWRIGRVEGAPALGEGDIVVLDLWMDNTNAEPVDWPEILDRVALVDDADRRLRHLVLERPALLETLGEALPPGGRAVRLVFRAHPESRTFRLELRGDNGVRSMPLSAASGGPRPRRVV